MDEKVLLQRLESNLAQRGAADADHLRYVDGKVPLEHLNIALPRGAERAAYAPNWAATYVNALLERMQVQKIIRLGSDREDDAARRCFDYNDGDVLIRQYAWDYVVFGRAFMVVSAAEDASGIPRLAVYSPRDMELITDHRGVTAGAVRYVRDFSDRIVAKHLYLPNETVYFEQSEKAGAGFVEADRVQHNLGRVPVIMGVNGARSGSLRGRSQIEPLKPILRHLCKTMTFLQFAQEALAMPQKYLFGIDKGTLTDEDGEKLSLWQTYFGSINVTPNPDAKIQQLPGADLTGFISTIKMLAEQASTVTGLPVRYMGQNTSNPAAEGAIRADESRLVKQVEAICGQLGRTIAWALELAELVAAGNARYSSDYVTAGKITVAWMDPGTPTYSQRADALQKLTGGQQILSVKGAQTELGFTPARIDQEAQWMEEEAFNPLARDVSLV